MAIVGKFTKWLDYNTVVQALPIYYTCCIMLLYFLFDKVY